ncbi:MAG: PD-(D/E)XK nuclease family protein, partial [Alphaproteobacteria bacterium]|nr:PD-(D/E)XK nuclease family protein [Alphaproteobacteria bacterium]
LGIARPALPGYSLNSAVDELLKKEFDYYRALQKPHPIMAEYGINAIPFAHSSLDDWRNNFKGIGCLHDSTGLYLYGAIDDVWITNDGEIIIVDYKSTSKAEKEVSLDDEWKDSWKKQLEVYSYIFQQNGYKVHDTAYFVYCNGKKELDNFEGKLDFDVTLVPYKWDASWVEEALVNAKACLDYDYIPAYSDNCDYCKYLIKHQEIL